MSGVLPPATAQKEQRRLSKISELLRRKEMLAGPVHPTSRPPLAPPSPLPRDFPSPAEKRHGRKLFVREEKKNEKGGPCGRRPGPFATGKRRGPLEGTLRPRIPPRRHAGETSPETKADELRPRRRG
ncbi:unnamed protein product [Ixodes persulcatus]